MTTEPDFEHMILEGIVALWNAGELKLKETPPGSGVHRYRFRAGGWPIDVDLDTTVLGLRVYHGRDVVANGSLSEPLMMALVGEGGPPPGQGSASEAIARLRTAVSRWKDENARLGITSPHVARHPDGWNNA